MLFTTLSESVHALKIVQKYDLVTNHMYRNHAFSQHNTLVVVMVLWLSEILGWFTVTQVDGGAFCVAFAIRNCDTGHMHVLEDQCSFADCLYNPTDICKCESASVLLQLNNYKPASIGKSRLSQLALLQIHYDTFVDMFMVVDCYVQLHPH